MVRTILVPLSGGAASEGTIETACRLAHRFGAHIEALHVRADPCDSLPLLACDISPSVTDELIAMAAKDSDARAAKAKRRLTAR
jgi:nucleotide-binding universal stress UspA family protein